MTTRTIELRADNRVWKAAAIVLTGDVEEVLIPTLGSLRESFTSVDFNFPTGPRSEVSNAIRDAHVPAIDKVVAECEAAVRAEVGEDGYVFPPRLSITRQYKRSVVEVDVLGVRP